MPKRKLMVPSSGSTTQLSPLLPPSRPPSSPPAPPPPHEPVVRPALRQQLADRPLRREVRLADEIGGRALAADLALAAAPGALDQEGASHPRGLHGHVEQALGLAHENPGGRCCAQGRADSICAASESSVASSSRRPTICTARGSPSEPRPAGTDAAGWPVTFQTPL